MNAKVSFSSHSEFLAARSGMSQTLSIGNAVSSRDHQEPSVADRCEIKSLAALESIFMSCLSTPQTALK